MTIEEELKEIEKRKALLDRQQEELMRRAQEQENTKNTILGFIEQQGFKDPQGLADKLAEFFGVRASVSRRQPNRRTRIRITKEVRDEVKAALSGGEKRKSISNRTGISYQTVTNIDKGKYDHL